MIFFKLLQKFLLPSVFVLVLILGGFIFRKKKFGKILIFLGIVIYYFFSITPVTDLILAPLENQYQEVLKNELDKADNVVLLLGDREADILRASEVIRIYHNFQFPISNFQIIISGTDPLNPEIKEAEEVKNYLIERGILAENIVLEDKSRTTFESAKNIKELVGTEPFFLVTSAYHMPRAMEVFQKIGTVPISAPTDFKRKGEYDILDFFPDAQNLRNSDLALHEYFGILFYRIFWYNKTR